MTIAVPVPFQALAPPTPVLELIDVAKEYLAVVAGTPKPGGARWGRRFA